MIFYIFQIVSKSLEKIKTHNVFVFLSIHSNIRVCVSQLHDHFILLKMPVFKNVFIDT